MTREEILKEALRCVTGEREQQYGSPEDSFMAIAELWTVYLEHGCVEDNGAVLLHPEDVAAMMALLKIARICTGKYKGDNWVDLAGYAACGGAWQSGNRPAEWELEDEEERRVEAKLKKLYAYCRLSKDCDLCPIKKDSDLFNLCHEKSFEDMDEGELDSRLTFFHNVVYSALAGVRLLLLDALKERPEPPKTSDLVRVVWCRVCQYCDRFAPEEGEYGCCELTGADVQPMDFCSQGERRNAR